MLIDITRDRREAYSSAIDWLVCSGIRNVQPETVTHGSYNSGYDRFAKAYPLAYCEITGYAVKLFLNLYCWESKNLYLKVAKEAADFLIRAKESGPLDRPLGPFPYGYHKENKTWDEYYYSFDTSMCASGFIDLYSKTRCRKYLQASKTAMVWLVSKAQAEDGSFRAVFKQRKGFIPLHTWFGDRGCLHAKNAIGLLKMYELTGETRFEESAIRVCDWVLDLQEESGAIRAKVGEKYISSHAHCYATEGLIYAGTVLNRKEYIERAIRAGLWLIKVQNKDGSVSKIKDKFTLFDQRVCDASSQAARIWAILYSLTLDQRYLEAAEKACRFFLSLQSNNEESRGGFYYGCYNILGKRLMSRWIYSWPAMFAVHALHLLYYDRLETDAHRFVSELF